MTAIDDYQKEIERLESKIRRSTPARIGELKDAQDRWQRKIDDLLRPLPLGDASERAAHPELVKD